MDFTVLRDQLPPDLVGKIDPESAWRRYRAEGGADDIEGFLAWATREFSALLDSTRVLLADPVDISSVLPSRFAAHGVGAATRVLEPTSAPSAVAPKGEARPEFPYQMLGSAGRGGMGTVHVARDTELSRRVALKELNADVCELEGVRERFIREAQITAQLDHPNVVPVYALEMTPQGTPAYTMKFVQGSTFQALIEETRQAYGNGLTPDDAHSQPTLLEHFLKVADAMAYAHDKGVIHRDLKPANLMLGRHHEVYVMDWGLCRLLNQPEANLSPDATMMLTSPDSSGSASQTRVGDVLGTPRYMSPEQAGARHDEIDARSDQYALGLILYEMVTLRSPYEGRDAREVLANARAGQRSPVTGAFRGVRIARELRAIIERATALQPAQRYPSVAELAADLRRYLRGQAVRTAPDSLWQRLQRGIAQQRQKVLIGILGLVALSAIAIGGLLWQNQRAIERQHLYEQRVQLINNAMGHVGDRIQTRLLQLEGALSNLASSTEQALQYAQPSEEPVYLLSDFSNPAKAPADLRPSPEFYGQISLRWPVWTLAPGLEASEALPRIQRLANLQPFYGELYRRIQDVVRGERNSMYSSRPLAPKENHGRVIVSGILLGLKDGIGSLYPGWDGFAPDFDPRQEPWYRNAVGRYTPQWGEPTEPTADGPSLLRLSIPIYDRDQDFLGVLALSLVPQRFLRDLLDVDGVEGLESVLLIDARGRVLASTREESDTAQDAAIAKQVIPALVASGGSALTVTLSGVEYLVASDNIDPVGWSVMAIALVRKDAGEAVAP